jgi:hypothetical protein
MVPAERTSAVAKEISEQGSGLLGLESRHLTVLVPDLEATQQPHTDFAQALQLTSLIPF